MPGGLQWATDCGDGAPTGQDKAARGRGTSAAHVCLCACAPVMSRLNGCFLPPGRYDPAVNWHQIIDERSFEMHQVIAEILRQSPEKLALVSAWIERRMSDPDYCLQSKDALQEWVDVIRTDGVAGVLRVLDDRGEEATRMRQSSPFAVLMPQEKRLEILNRYDARRPRTHPAGV